MPVQTRMSSRTMKLGSLRQVKRSTGLFTGAMIGNVNSVGVSWEVSLVKLTSVIPERSTLKDCGESEDEYQKSMNSGVPAAAGMACWIPPVEFSAPKNAPKRPERRSNVSTPVCPVFPNWVHPVKSPDSKPP